MTSTPAQRAVSLWGLAGRQIARDFRAGELRLLVVAVMLAVAALTALSDTSREAPPLSSGARPMLGNEAVVADSKPSSVARATKAAGVGWSLATIASPPSIWRASREIGRAHV